MSDLTEMEVRQTASQALEIAQSRIVQTNEDYQEAGNARRYIKEALSKISDYWTPKKEQAYKLHKSLVAAEKEMKQPLEKADKTITSRMEEYRLEIARRQREAEEAKRKAEEIRRRAEEEARRLAEEAAQKEELDDDDVELLQIAQEELEQSESLVDSVEYVPVEIKAEGISVRKKWKARVVKEYKVPIAVAGITIRPIDQSALNKLAVLSKGECDCPGVEFYQEESTMVRL